MRNDRGSILAFAVVCLLSAPACISRGDPKTLSIDPARRGFEIPPRPVILFFVDGLRQDVFEELASQGKLPLLSRHLLDRGTRVRAAVTGVPSVTYANATSMVNGCLPGTHGVWGNVWFDREQQLTHNYEIDSTTANNDASRPSLYELMSTEVTAAVAVGVHRGAKMTFADSLKKPEGWEAWTAWIMDREERTDKLLSEQLFEVEEQARKLGEWPAFTLVHLPAVDHLGHHHGSDGHTYRSAVENLDESIGGVLEAFAKGGMLDQLTIVLTADHGHHSTPWSFALDKFLPSALGVPIFFDLKDDGASGYVERVARYSKTDVVLITNGERVASLYLRMNKSWKNRPSAAEILAFPVQVDGRSASQPLPERLLAAPSIDIVVLRDGENQVQVHGRRGVGAIERSSSTEGPLYRYRLLSGKDPLGYHDDERLRDWIGDEPHASRAWLEATATQRRPDMIPQLIETFDSQRSGDVILFAAPGWDFSVEKYNGGHGGLEREEMLVPLYLAGPGIRAGHEIPAARLVDVVPTLLELTGAKIPVSATFDGVSLVREL